MEILKVDQRCLQAETHCCSSCHGEKTPCNSSPSFTPHMWQHQMPLSLWKGHGQNSSLHPKVAQLHGKYVHSFCGHGIDPIPLEAGSPAPNWHCSEPGQKGWGAMLWHRSITGWWFFPKNKQSSTSKTMKNQKQTQQTLSSIHWSITASVQIGNRIEGNPGIIVRKETMAHGWPWGRQAVADFQRLSSVQLIPGQPLQIMRGFGHAKWFLSWNSRSGFVFVNHGWIHAT